MDDAGDGGPDPVQHVAAEAQRLAAAVTDWVRAGRQGTRSPEPGGTKPGATAAGGGPACDADPVCGVCPVCRGAALLRSLSPEVIERVADLAGMAAESLAAMAAERRRRAGDDGR